MEKKRKQEILDALHCLLIAAGVLLGIYWFFSYVDLAVFIVENFEFFKRYGFIEYLESEFGGEVRAALLKFFFGIGLMIGGIVDVVSYKKQVERRKFASWSAAASGKTVSSQAQNYPAYAVSYVASWDEWKCPDCGRINKKYVSTCACGRNQNDRTVQAAGGSDSNAENKDSVTCPGCGADCGGDSRFCTMCGAKLKD